MTEPVVCLNCGRSEEAHTREKIIGLDKYRLLCDFYRGDPRKYGVRCFMPTRVTTPEPEPMSRIERKPTGRIPRDESTPENRAAWAAIERAAGSPPTPPEPSPESGALREAATRMVAHIKELQRHGNDPFWTDDAHMLFGALVAALSPSREPTTERRDNG